MQDPQSLPDLTSDELRALSMTHYVRFDLYWQSGAFSNKETDEFNEMVDHAVCFLKLCEVIVDHKRMGFMLRFVTKGAAKNVKKRLQAIGHLTETSRHIAALSLDEEVYSAKTMDHMRRTAQAILFLSPSLNENQTRFIEECDYLVRLYWLHHNPEMI